MNRRQFIGQASRAALFAWAPPALATPLDKDDLIIRGGRVIDPLSRLDAVRDIAISDGRIVGVKGNITGEAAEMRDDLGKLVEELEETCDKFEVAKQRRLERERKVAEKKAMKNLLVTSSAAS